MNDLITYFMSLTGQVKLFHWSTKSYVHHKALDELYGALSSRIDLFVEAYAGKRKEAFSKKFMVATKSTSDASQVMKYLEEERGKLTKVHDAFSSEPELSNILEEMMAAMGQAMYLMRLM